MTPTAAVRSILGDYIDRDISDGTHPPWFDDLCREVVVAVLGACREPTRGMVARGAAALTDGQARCRSLPRLAKNAQDDWAVGPALVTVPDAYAAMIDALIEEVTAEGGR